MIPLFAWADPAETTFVEATHAREDEDVFAFELSQSEGDFAQLSVTLRNPRAGFLRPDRKQWAWFSARMSDDGVIPLFFGRLIGVPSNIFGELVTVEFVARPADFLSRKAALADALRVLPHYDPIFIDAARREDPDVVLEARTALWHVDRVTHELTISDILVGEDGVVEVTPDDHFYDALEMNLGNIPLRRASVEAVIPWTQSARGWIDFSGYIVRQWPGGNGHAIHSYTYSAFANSWPQAGANIGKGWFVFHGEAVLLNEPKVVQHGYNVQTQPAQRKKSHFDFYPGWVTWTSQQTISASRNWDTVWAPNAMRFPQALTSYGYSFDYDDDMRPTSSSSSGAYKQIIVACGMIKPRLVFGYEVDRKQAERITFTLTSDVQPIVTLPEEDEVLQLTLNTVDVTAPLTEGGDDAPLADPRARSYISTPRGLQSLEYLIALARAHLAMRSRAVEISFGTTFEKAVGITLRKNVTLHDDRIPNGQATGKVTAYRIGLDGDSGALDCRITIGCAIGRDGEIELAEGTPTYCDPAYIGSEYQAYAGRRLVPIAGVGYEQPLAAPNDDGFDFVRGLRIEDVLRAMTVQNPPTVQAPLIDAAGQMAGGMQGGGASFWYPEWVVKQWVAEEAVTRAVERINDVLKERPTSLNIKLKPLTGEFESSYEIAVTDLKLPRMIDLENA
jgi:hypothetical protein